MFGRNLKVNLNIINFSKNKKFNMSLAKYSISLGEDPNWHMPYYILTCPFLIFLTKICIFANLFGLTSIDAYFKPLQSFSSIVAYWHA
jgi:hypothetical protein